MLPKIHLFSELSPEELREIEALAVREEIRRGKLVFQEGDMSRDLFIIESGEVELSVRDVTGIPKIITVLHKNDFFGEMSLLDRSAPRSATARVTRNAVFMRLPAERLEPLLDAPTQLSRNIHSKILQALSTRLRQMTQRAASLIKGVDAGKGKIITVSSARSGDGKTTLATTLAAILARESGKRVLFIDLDRHYGDATFLMGGYSQKSIVTLCRALRGSQLTHDELMFHFTSLSERLWLLAAPSTVMEAEELRAEDLAGLFHTCQKLFDYLIVDTAEGLCESALTAIEAAERTLFLTDARDIISIKNSVRFLQVLSNLKVPESRITVIANKSPEDLRLDQLPATRFKITATLPEMQDNSRQEGKTLYQLNPQHRFCIVIRDLVRNLLQENTLAVPQNRGFLSRFLAPRATTQKDNAEGLSSGSDSPGAGPAISPESISGLIDGIKLLLEEGDSDEAETEARHLLYFCHDSPDLYQIFAEILLCRNATEEAILVLRKALKLDERNGMVLGLLGSITGERNLILQGITLVQERLKKTPTFPDLLNDLGRLQFFAGNLDEAQAAFKKALAQNPEFREARVNLAVACGENGNPEEGLKVLAPLVKRGLRGHYLAGCFHQLLGNFAEAFEELKRAAAKRQEYHDLPERLEHLNAYFRKLEALVDIHRRYLEKHPRFPDLHLKLADLLEQMGKHEEARKALQDALELNPALTSAKQRLEKLAAKGHKAAA